jgi:hypothetical protein
MPDNGPAKVVYEHLAPYLHGNAAYVHIDFNFGSKHDKDSFLSRLNTLVDLFKIDGKLNRYE